MVVRLQLGPERCIRSRDEFQLVRRFRRQGLLSFEKCMDTLGRERHHPAEFGRIDTNRIHPTANVVSRGNRKSMFQREANSFAHVVSSWMIVSVHSWVFT